MGLFFIATSFVFLKGKHVHSLKMYIPYKGSSWDKNGKK